MSFRIKFNSSAVQDLRPFSSGEYRVAVHNLGFRAHFVLLVVCCSHRTLPLDPDLDL